jgi:gas vesicle protein
LSNNQNGATALQVGRYGLIGAVIGAVIGGVGSFSGAYLTYRQQRDTHDIDMKRASYVTLASEAEQYRQVMSRMIDAAKEKDQEAYRKERDRILSESSVELYSAATTIYILGNSDLSGKANAVLDAFFGPAETTLAKDYDVNKAEKAEQKGREALRAFQRAAREDLQKMD